MTLKPGQHLWWHYSPIDWKRGDAQWIDPMTAVRDDSQALVAWLAPGTEVLKTVLDTGEDVRAAPLGERLAHGKSMAKTRWRGEAILRVAPTGLPWSVWVFWEPGWKFAGWYVNLETPMRREGPNVYMEDQVLDVWVTLDRTCHRKFEDELAAGVAEGRYIPEAATLITRKADAAEEAVRRF